MAARSLTNTSYLRKNSHSMGVMSRGKKTTVDTTGLAREWHSSSSLWTPRYDCSRASSRAPLSCPDNVAGRIESGYRWPRTLNLITRSSGRAGQKRAHRTVVQSRTYYPRQLAWAPCGVSGRRAGRVFEARTRGALGVPACRGAPHTSQSRPTRAMRRRTVSFDVKRYK